MPYLIIGMIPAFFEDFLVEVRKQNVLEAVGNFSRTRNREYVNPIYTFAGIERREQRFEYTVTFRRNGLLTASHQLPLIPRDGVHQIGVAPITQRFAPIVAFKASDFGAPHSSSQKVSLTVMLSEPTYFQRRPINSPARKPV